MTRPHAEAAFPNQCCSAAHVPYCLHQLPFCQLASYKKRGAVTLGRTHPFQPRLTQETQTSWVATHSLIYLHSPTPAPPMSKVLFSWVTSPGVASVTMMWRAICYKRQFEFGGKIGKHRQIHVKGHNDVAGDLLQTKAACCWQNRRYRRTAYNVSQQATC